MSSEVTVIDYGVGNLFSVCRALEHCGAKPVLASTPEAIRDAGKILLPGVGAFQDGMAQLRTRGMEDAIKSAAANGTPLLGVCLGMQLLLDRSEEFGATNGLGLISGDVVAIPHQTTSGKRLKIPHIGWSSLQPAPAHPSWTHTLIETLAPGTAMYFIHSFMAKPHDDACRVADCMYEDIRIAAVIRRGKVWGTQFHPEKSGEAGLALLRQFVRHV